MKEYSREQKLLEGLARNAYSDVDTIYQENFGLVQTFVTKNNGNFDDARDVFQEAMVVLYEKSRDPEFTLTCQIRTYLFSVCRRLWLKKLQQQNRYFTPIESMEELVPVEEEIEEKEKLDSDFEKMELAMESLGEPCKSLLKSFYIHKKNMVDIASDFGYTNADNAKNQKYKCLIRLRRIFFAQHNNK